MSFVPYSPSVECVPEDEPETIRGLKDAFEKLARLQEEKEGHAMRTSHAKATAFLEGELEILDGLPPELAQGIAAKPGRYQVLVRFAQGPGELLDDSISTHRGMAIKILDVDGPRIPESLEQSTQDFVLEPGSAFIHSTPKTFLADFKLGVSNAPRMPDSFKGAVSNVARATEAVVEALGGKSKLLGFLGHPSLHPLAENYFSQAPMRWGDYIAKVAMAVTDDTLAAIGEEKIDASDDPNAFRHAMESYFQTNGATFALMVQLDTDLDKMPVEDASVDWPQEESPYRPVARLHFPPQDAYTEEKRKLFDEQLTFQPNDSIEAHRPLGGIMRSRLQLYPLMARRRMEADGHRHCEPQPSAIESVPAE